MKKINILFLLLLIIASLSAQNKRLVTGQVLFHHYGEDYADFAIGVTVHIVGNNGSLGTSTDLDGNYKIQVSADDVLEFQYYGAKTHREKVKKRSIINVTLERDRYSDSNNSTYDVSSDVYGAAMGTYSDRTFGQSYDVLCTFQYKFSNNLLYDKIKRHMGIGVNIAKINPKDDNIKGTLYLRADPFKWFGFNKQNVMNFSPYITAGLYVDAYKGAIRSQNLEYRAGFNFAPTGGKFPNWISFNAGYQGFARQSAYNNFYLGIRIRAVKAEMIWD